VNEQLKIWYHGTTEDAARSILREGFRAGTYFAEHLEDAVWFGGGFVFEVAFPATWTSEAGWQMTVAERFSPDRIVGLWRFTPEQLHENAALRTAVFESQPAEKIVNDKLGWELRQKLAAESHVRWLALFLLVMLLAVIVLTSRIQELRARVTALESQEEKTRVAGRGGSVICKGPAARAFVDDLVGGTLAPP
jgi:hypothetical protein